MNNKITFQEFIKTKHIKRGLFMQRDKKKLLKYFILSGILVIVTFLASLKFNSTLQFGFSFLILIICGILISLYLLKEKIILNNKCPHCEKNNFYPNVETKKTTVSYSSSKSIYERGTNGKYIGTYQEGTQVDGAKYQIIESTSKKELTNYDWYCNDCGHLENFAESFSHVFYIVVAIGWGICGIYFLYYVLL